MTERAMITHLHVLPRSTPRSAVDTMAIAKQVKAAFLGEFDE